MKSSKKSSFHRIYLAFSFGYSLVLHVFFGLVILYSFPVYPFMDRPPEDYLIVMLTSKTEISDEVKDKEVVEPPPVTEEQPLPIPEQIPKPAEPMPQEVIPQMPEEPVTPPPVQEVAPSEPLLEEVDVGFPIPEPPPLVEAIVNEPVFTEPEPPPFFPELSPIVNQPLMPLPEPEMVLPVEEPMPLPPLEEVAQSEPLLEEVEKIFPTPETPSLVAEADPIEQEFTEPEPLPFSPTLPPIVNLPTMPLPETEEPAVFSEAVVAEVEQDQPGPEVEESVPEEPAHVDSTAPTIVVTEPREGAIINIMSDNTITVRGTLDDPDINEATVILNGNRVEIEVHEGLFETVLSAVTDENTLLVEAINKTGLKSQSSFIHFTVIQSQLRDIQVVLSSKTSCRDIRLTALKGVHPLSRDYRPFRPPIKIKDSTVDYENDSPYLAKLMDVQKSRSGVYTIRLDADPSRIVSDCDPYIVVILYGYNSDRVRTKVFQPSFMSDPGKGPWISAKFLMPQGFFWGDDDWTDGQVEDSRSRTKFNTSLGIIWKELK